ncbi:MAG: hypothetical protein VX239_01000, partial [Candidatus Thermoplasmatota archaeon]|nr:hypothetical protein [Candidatus Thermoplasmatota archaeon]
MRWGWARVTHSYFPPPSTSEVSADKWREFDKGAKLAPHSHRQRLSCVPRSVPTAGLEPHVRGAKH